MTRPEQPAGISKQQWDHHWTHYSVSTEANPAQAMRRRLIRRLLGANAASQDSAILDIGCGSGDLLAEMARHFPEAAFAGCDLSESGLVETAIKLPSARLAAFDFSTPGKTPGDLQGWASHAVCSEVLEHVDDPAVVLANIVPCLKPGGRLVVTVPGGPMSAFDKHLGHQRHFTKAKIKDLLEAAGLRVETVAGAGFPMFNLYRMVVIARGKRLVDDAGGKSGLLARAVMATFGVLLQWTLLDSPWGWQIVAVAHKPD